MTKTPSWTFHDEQAGTTTVFKRRPILTWLRNLLAVFLIAAVATPSYPVGTYTEAAAKATYQAGYPQEAPVFIAVPQFQATNTAIETQAFLFVNLATNTVAANIQQIAAETPYGKSSNNTYRVYINPVVVSSGTSVTITPNRVSTSNTSQMQVFTGPSASSTGTLVGVFSIGANLSTVNVLPGFPYGIDIDTATKMLITVLPTAASTATLNISWTERAP